MEELSPQDKLKKLPLVPFEPKDSNFINLDSIVSREFLKLLSESSDGFTIIEDPHADTAFTEIKTKKIHMPSFMLYGDKQRGIEPIKNLKGVIYHEIGHHLPNVVPLQQKIWADAKSIEIPESYKGSKSSEERFINAVWKNVGNVVADIWLESNLSRSPFYAIRSDITNLNKELGEPTKEFFTKLSKPMQLAQAVLRARHFDVDYSQMLDEDVYKEFKLITNRRRQSELSPLEIIMDTRAFDAFPTPSGKSRSIEQKFLVYKEIMVPAYIRLLEKELEKRAKQKGLDSNKSNSPDQNQDGSQQGGGGFLDKIKKFGKSGGGSDIPMTKNEEEELKKIINQIIDELEESAKGHTLAPSEEDKIGEKNAIQGVKGEIDKRHSRSKQQNTNSDQNPGNETEDFGPKGLEAVERLRRELERESREKRQRGLSADHQVRQETVDTWEKIKKDHMDEIQSLASELSEIFLEDRRKRIDYLKREGEIVPGLETETIAAILSGDLDPDTKLREIQNPKFLETEIEFIVDTSGSMMGDRIQESVNMMVAVTESFKRIQETLEEELLIIGEEMPFKIGLTKFSVGAQRVTKLTDKLDDHKELIMIEKASEVGGGTDEADAIKNVYKSLRLNTDNVIKIIIMLSDGDGNKQAVADILNQIENDKDVIFLALGLGSNTGGVIDTYVKPLLNGENSNVYGIEAPNPKLIIQEVIKFLKREVGKRRTSL